MNRTETADLLSVIVNLDPRRGLAWQDGAGAVDAWQPLISTLTYEQALSAVRRHYARSSEPILVTHILQIVNAETTRRYDDREDNGCSLRSCSCTHTAPCEGGWIELEPAGRRGHAVVRRCPNCVPAAKI